MKRVKKVKIECKVKEFFGLLPNWKVDTQKLMREIKKGWKE